MISSDGLYYIGGFLTISFVSLLVRVFWAGLQTKFANALLEGGLKHALEPLHQDLKTLRNEVSGMRTDVDFIRATAADMGTRLTLSDSQMNGLRDRVDNLMEAEQARVEESSRFKIMVMDFVARVGDFMNNHTHASSPPQTS